MRVGGLVRNVLLIHSQKPFLLLHSRFFPSQTDVFVDGHRRLYCCLCSFLFNCWNLSFSSTERGRGFRLTHTPITRRRRRRSNRSSLEKERVRKRISHPPPAARERLRQGHHSIRTRSSVTKSSSQPRRSLLYNESQYFTASLSVQIPIQNNFISGKGINNTHLVFVPKLV